MLLTMDIDRWWMTCLSTLITLSNILQPAFVLVAPLDLLPHTARVASPVEILLLPLLLL